MAFRRGTDDSPEGLAAEHDAARQEFETNRAKLQRQIADHQTRFVERKASVVDRAKSRIAANQSLRQELEAEEAAHAQLIERLAV